MPKFKTWSERSAARKEARQGPAPEEGLRQPPGGKNASQTRAWCRGKPGVEHRPVVGTYERVKGWSRAMARGWLVRYCADCGKELDYYHPPFLPGQHRPPPDWAEAFFRKHPEERPASP